MSFLASSRLRREERLRFIELVTTFTKQATLHTPPTTTPRRLPTCCLSKFCQTIGRLPQSSRRSHSRAHGGCGGRGDVPSRLRPGTRRHRVETGDQPLQVRPVRGVGQGEEPGL